MPHMKLEQSLSKKLEEMRDRGALKGSEMIVSKVKPSAEGKGPRFYIEGFGDKEFLRMNSNSYLGMSFQNEIVESEEKAAQRYGTGPGAVRFISGTYQPHVELEKKLAEFHNRQAAMIFSSAYAAMLGTLASLVDSETIIVSDELNHNCIINGIRLSRPKIKEVYKHLDMQGLDSKIKENIGKGKRLLVITDGIFSMRGDYAPLDTISKIAQKFNNEFEEGVTTLVDDSHGVGAFGKTGRGTEEYTQAKGIDIIIATLGKALGVNGGYVATSSTIVRYLRETSPLYIYSNPITTSEACAAIKSLEILNSQRGIELISKLRTLTRRFEKGLIDLGYEVIQSEHPVVPLMVRDTKKTSELVKFLFENNILATGLNYPVVPKGDEEIRFQVNADHTEKDIDYALSVLKEFRETVAIQS